jgi:hypothetical protein
MQILAQLQRRFNYPGITTGSIQNTLKLAKQGEQIQSITGRLG